MFLRNIIVGAVGAALVVGGAAGCGPAAVKRACVGGSGGDSSLVTDAALLRLDVYEPPAQCDGSGMLAPGAGAAVLSHTYAKGQAVKLDVPPGQHTFVLTTFADDAGSVILGEACTEQNVQAGAQLCFDLTLQPGPDAGVDLAACGPNNPACQCMTDADCQDPSLPRCSTAGHCVACLPQNDNCSFDHYCDPGTLTCNSGCKSNAECAQLAAADGGVPPSDKLCDPTRHVCVQCLGNNDCPANQLCSSAGTCVPGCDLAAGKPCPGTLTCCNKQCIDTTSDPFNCNGCGNVCTGGATLCCNGSCKNPQIDADNCGGCGKVCSSNHMATRTCGGGVCNGNCSPSFGDCDGNKLTNGCEVDLTSTTNHCGMCNINCGTQIQNANGAFCNASSCDYTTCTSASFADCDMVRSNGCEVNLTNTTNHCGTCGVNCSTQVLNATGISCSASACNYTACGASNFSDCNGNRTDGCEVNTNTAVANCGTCGTNCNTNVKNATGAYCNTGSCDYASCSGPTFKDCNANRTDGCEVNISSDVSNCGACNRACSTNNVTGGLSGLSCSGGLCNTMACNSPYGNCSQPSAPAADDGCEQNEHDINHCGSCTTVCAYANAGSTCATGTCAMGSCNAGFFNCDGATGNGCEAPGYDFGGGKGCCSATTPATSGTPQIAHDNGLGSVAPAGTPTAFYDCLPLGTPKINATYSQQLAMDAANQSSFYTSMYPPFVSSCGVANSNQSSICIQTPSIGICWAYTGTTTKLGNPPRSFPSGYVDFNNVPGDSKGGLENIYCPSPDYTLPAGGDPSWQ